MYQSDGCVQNGVAVLVCFALNGFHPITTYKWYSDDDIVMVTNPFPVLYTEEIGNYKCIMESEKVHEFTAVGKSQLRHPPLIYSSYVLAIGSVIMCYIQMESTF